MCPERVFSQATKRSRRTCPGRLVVGGEGRE
jgi:hypothetical protein